MDNFDLLTAIGGAEDTYLLELEQPKLRRLPKHFGLIAALIALLLTACAAPAVLRTFDKLQAANRSDTGNGYTIYEYHDRSGKPARIYFQSSDAEIEVSVNPDAPNTLKTQYLPTKLLEYCDPVTVEVTEAMLSMELSAKAPRFGKIYGALYQQYALPESGNITVPRILGSDRWEKAQRTYGDITVLEFEGESFEYTTESGENILYGGNRIPSFYTKILFWSDGDYLYCLKIPVNYYLPLTAIEEILTSLTAVEDISQYLPAE